MCFPEVAAKRSLPNYSERLSEKVLTPSPEFFQKLPVLALYSGQFSRWGYPPRVIGNAAGEELVLFHAGPPSIR